MPSRARSSCLLFLGLAMTDIVACGGAPAVSADRASGQSGLMDKTYAGANRCNPKNHDRPFVVEWDATDMSQFEALTTNDIVFVKYEGCDLKVIDSCRQDDVKGSLGAYRTVDYTSGSIERVDIKNEGELHAKLPLSSATLGGRVNAGESFVMEYFVAGTRTATRSAEYKADLAKIPGCKGVTHFVYAYNVGAFALGSSKNIKAEAGVSVFGGKAGGGASQNYSTAAEKKGGQLATCRSDSAQEVAGCKVPIRLTLRAIDDGTNPDQTAALAPETPDAKNLAGKVQRERANESDAEARLEAANEKALHGDGKGCLAELDAHDKLQKGSSTLSTTPNSKSAWTRSACLMQAGQCDAGRELERKNLEKMGGGGSGANAAKSIDMIVQGKVAQFCQGATMKPREELIRAVKVLHDGNFAAANNEKIEAKVCRDAYATIKKHKDSERADGDLVMLPIELERAANCFVAAGDCAGGFTAYKEQRGGKTDPKIVRKRFDAQYPACKGK